MIVTLKIKLDTYWSCDIELDENSTLEDLHNTIQYAVDFDNDHLYAFFVARNQQAGDRIVCDEENGRIFDTVIANVFPLPPKKRFFYLFDYGDNWVFSVSKSRKLRHAAIDGTKYPRIANETGEKPIQYDFGG